MPAALSEHDAFIRRTCVQSQTLIRIGVVCDTGSSSDKTAEIMAVQNSNSASKATTGHGCKGSVLPLVPSFCETVGSRVVTTAVF
jgi:hypothetical protein